MSTSPKTRETTTTMPSLLQLFLELFQRKSTKLKGVLVCCDLHLLQGRELIDAPLRDVHVFRATVMRKLLYSTGMYTGFCSAANSTRLHTLLGRFEELEYCDINSPSIAAMSQEVNDSLFQNVHVLLSSEHLLHISVSRGCRMHSQV